MEWNKTIQVMEDRREHLVPGTRRCDQSPCKIHVGWGWLCQLCGGLERQGQRNTHAPASRTCEMVKALTSQCTAGNLLKKPRIIALIDSSPT